MWVLGGVSLLMDVSSEMVHSLLPMFMATVLGASAFSIGLIEGAAEATALMVKVFSGVLSDHFGRRKPLALIGYAATWLWSLASGDTFPMPFGPRMLDFIGLMFVIGLFSSWLGTLCWNEASQRLPPTLSGQLIVFETLAALSYAFVLRNRWPEAETLTGVALLMAGVVWAMRAQPAEVSADAHPN